MHIRSRTVAVAVAVAAVLAGGGIVVEGTQASAMCPVGGCLPGADPVDPADPADPVQLPKPPNGKIKDLSFSTDGCEPRKPPWNYFTYRAPGSDHTVISRSRMSDGVYVDLAQYSSYWVSAAYEGHGTYRVQSFDAANHVLDTWTRQTC